MNTGLKKLENATSREFTSSSGMKNRKKINKVWRLVLENATRREIILEQYPNLETNKSYIFAAYHSFDEDVISILSKIDRNAYVLNGTTDQLEHNPVMIALWLNGMIYVNRLDEESRDMSIFKMERVLHNGNSVMLFVGGGYNNTENKLMPPPFNGASILSKNTNVLVLPTISFNDFGSDKIYVRVGEPLPLFKYNIYEASNILRDHMATILYDTIQEHTKLVKRDELTTQMFQTIYNETRKRKGNLERITNLPKDPRIYWMEMRKMVYECQKWYNDVWHEELTEYTGHNVTSPVQMREYIDNISINQNNVKILADVLVRREEDKYFNMENYMRNNIQLNKDFTRVLKKS